MFKITKTVKQIFYIARNISKAASASIHSSFKYSSGSKEYVEDASDKFTFLKAPLCQSSNPSIQDKFSAFTPNPQDITKTQSTQLLDPAEIRKLIYARFADEIAAKPSDATENQNLKTKSHATNKPLEIATTYNITDEFKDLKSQGYDFKELRDAIIDHNTSKGFEESVISDNSRVRDNISKSLSDRMKELSISGHISRYAGDPHLREDIEKVIPQKALVIHEFMERVTSKVDELEEHSTELLG